MFLGNVWLKVKGIAIETKLTSRSWNDKGEKKVISQKL